MLKHRNEQIQFIVRSVDFVVGVVSFLVAYALRSSPFLVRHYGATGTLESFSWLLAASLAVHFLVYPSVGFYQSLRLKSPFEIFRMVFRAALLEVFILGSLVFFFQAKETSRYFFGLFLVMNYALVLAEKLGARALLSGIRTRGYNYRQVLIIGTGKSALAIVEALQRNKHWGYVPCGLVSMGEGDQAAGATGTSNIEILGAIGDLEQIIKSRTVDEVYFALDRIDPAQISSQLELCESMGLPVRFSLGFLPLRNSRVMYSVLDGMPVLTYYNTVLKTPVETVLKRLMDIIIAAIGLLVTGILYPWIAYRIRRESPGPVIFKQYRVGENGRKFKCYKFRTMVLDAEARKRELEAGNQMKGPLFKIEQDPRVFPFGAFLRRTSLDELPQFLNVIRGEMSIVGTRPPTPDEVARYQDEFRRRLSIRPGITGLWQVSGRNEIKEFADVLKIDLEYIDRWSLWLDLKIILRTIFVMIRGKGAF